MSRELRLREGLPIEVPEVKVEVLPIGKCKRRKRRITTRGKTIWEMIAEVLFRNRAEDRRKRPNRDRLYAALNSLDLAERFVQSIVYAHGTLTVRLSTEPSKFFAA